MTSSHPPPPARPSITLGWLASLALVALACPAERPPSTPDYLPWESAPPQSFDFRSAACIAAQVPRAPAELQRFLSDLKALRVRQIRWEIPWAVAETTRGAFDLAPHDARVDALAAAGLEQILILSYGNPLYSEAGATHDGDEMYPPDDPRDFARYTTALVDRYRDRVRHWEVWNEPNAGFRFWKPEANASGYAALLEQAFLAVKGSCADCEVILGAPVTLAYPGFGVPPGPDFLREVRAAGGTRFDAAAVHAYTLYPPCAPPEGTRNLCAVWPRAETPFPEQVAAVREAAGGPGPFRVTEYGWPSWVSLTGKGDVTEAMQAAWLVRGTLLLARSGARSLCWYTLWDGPDSGQFPPEGDFGLRRLSGEGKPAFDAFAGLFALGGGFARDRSLELDLRPGEFALLFEAGDRLVTYLWREESARPRKLRLPLHGPATTTRLAPGPSAESVPDGAFLDVTLDPAPLAVSCHRPTAPDS